MIKTESDKNKYILGIDIGGTKICISSINTRGKRIHTDFYFSDHTNQDAIVSNLKKNIKHFLEKYPDGKPEIIGIGMRGHIDKKNGVLISDIMLSSSSSIPIASIIEDEFKIRTVIDNDIHCAALAERYFGTGLKYNDFVYINIGTGIAIGIVSGGKLVRGESNYAGEFGHTLVDSNGDSCQCGFFGCLEPIASGNGISKQILKFKDQFPDSELHNHIENNRIPVPIVFDQYDKGDALAQLVVNKAVKALGIGIVNVINLLNPGAVIFGGGVVSDGWIIPRIKAEVEKHLQINSFKLPKDFRESHLGSKYVGVMGAACLGWEAENE